jgi:epoxyqueuosine reductase
MKIMHTHSLTEVDRHQLAQDIKHWGKELGFSHTAISHGQLKHEEAGLLAWLAAGYHGDMHYMQQHGLRRARPQELVPGTLSIISVTLPYRASNSTSAQAVLADPNLAYISRYALGRDYHKVVKKKLQKLAQHIENVIGPFGHRVFSDSAPVLEVALGKASGIGWRGKHTLLLTQEKGSLFFLGELFIDMCLPADAPKTDEHCGSCTRCLEVCPTQAIIAPYKLDARRCISYLTIELKGSIPEALRPLIGNRVYGCDDCQLFCPWNRFAVDSLEPDFQVRHGLDQPSLITLFAWDKATFATHMAGSAIYRIGYEQWLRNLAVGLGNAPTSAAVIQALRARQSDASSLVREHVQWALAQHLGF